MQTEILSTGIQCRPSTTALHHRAVERAIETMRERLDDSLSLQDMARAAILSPYHFNRVFRRLAGIPPSQFLYALRLEAARRLLLTTPFSVTDVCFEVGYNSLGTFTLRFTHLVGLPPRHLRLLARHVTTAHLKSLSDFHAHLIQIGQPTNGITGIINAPENFDGLIFVGLFSTPIPQANPLGCTLMTGSGPYCIQPVPDGQYYVLTAALGWSDDPAGYMLHHDALRGSAGPLWVKDGKVMGQTNVTLRTAELTDPPILISLPFLLTRLATKSYAAVAATRA